MSRLSLLSKLNILFSFGVVVITVGAYLIYNRLEYRDNYFTGLRFEKAAQIVREAHQNKQPFPIHELKLMDLELIKDLKSVKEKKKVISIPIPKYYIGVFNTNKVKNTQSKVKIKISILRIIESLIKQKSYFLRVLFFQS